MGTKTTHPRPAVGPCRARADVRARCPADTVFLRARRGAFDVVVACYHDQGLIPVKLLAFGQAVNVTLGLPIVRTSVDHGTAFDIAGRGIADPASMIDVRLEAGRPDCRTVAVAWHAPDGVTPWPRCPMAEQTDREKAQRIAAENRKALHDYQSSRPSRRASCCREPR